jgi:hypothetical protein
MKAGMLALATQHSSAYLAGNLVAIVGLAAGALRLGLRAFDRRGRRADAAAASFLPPAPPAPGYSTSGSVPPPGFPEPVRTFVPTASPAPARRVGRSPRDRTTDALAALVCCVLLIGALVPFAGRVGSDGPWDTPEGRLLRGSFVAGCKQSQNGLVDCDCVFEHMTASPPGDTPAGFVMLSNAINVAVSRRDVRLVPPQVRDALLGCQTA